MNKRNSLSHTKIMPAMTALRAKNAAGKSILRFMENATEITAIIVSQAFILTTNQATEMQTAAELWNL